ncbi:MAG: GTP-binding protein [Candidatus Thorarchaeota archaeon]|nr:MAG: GTP-binding protein [Candidatus Thorarchaeota archaeon]
MTTASYTDAFEWSVLILPENVDYLFKFVFLGEGAVGKTSLVGRYVYDSFEGDYLATIGTDIHIKMVNVSDTVVKLVIWDIAGQDNFAQLRRAYYMNASAAFFVFDTTRPETIERVDEWLNALFTVTGKIPLVLLENKVDLTSAITEKARESAIKNHDVQIIPTSAKEDMNVEEAFQKMTQTILEKSRGKKTV